MTAARDQILGAIAKSLRASPEDGRRQAVEARISARARNLVPDRVNRPHAALVDLFQEKVEAVAGTVARVPALGDVPQAVADYLRAANLPAMVRTTPHPTLEAIDWGSVPSLERSSGPAQPTDATTVTAVAAAVAETGTLMLRSGPDAPITSNFLPDTHIAVVAASQVVGAYEDGFDRLRAELGAGVMPRAVNFITGPSRTADIEQTLQLGAHGPRALHVIVIEDS